MLDERQARVIAVAEAKSMPLGAARELRQGWHFPFASTGHSVVVGSAGIIVHKQTGFPYMLGSAISPELVLQLYDLGFQAGNYDLTIVRTADRLTTSRVLGALNLQVIEESFEHGTHWKIPRRMRPDEIEMQLDNLPCTFTNVATYFCADKLQEVRRQGVFEFTLSNPRRSR